MRSWRRIITDAREKAIKESSFDAYERDITQGRIETIEREKQAQEIKISNLKKDKRKALRWIKDIFSAKGLEKLPAQLIASLVENVIVYDKHEFEVVYKFNMESLKEESNE